MDMNLLRKDVRFRHYQSFVVWIDGMKVRSSVRTEQPGLRQRDKTYIVGDNINVTKHHVRSMVRFDTLFCRDIESFLLF